MTIHDSIIESIPYGFQIRGMFCYGKTSFETMW